MKKTLVLLLILATLAPMVLAQPVSAAAEKEPFYTLGWIDFDEAKYPYIDGLVTSDFTNFGEYAILSYGNEKVQYGSYTDADLTKLVTALKTKMESRPAGARYWHLFGPSRILTLAPDDVLYLEHGVEQLQELMSAVFKKMQELKCPLDGVVIDTEIYAFGAWYLWGNSGNHSIDWYYNNNKNLYADIVKNPKYKKLIRPLLEEYGFPFYPNPSGHKSEIFYICYESAIKKTPEHSRAVSIWNTVMRVHLNRYATQWLYEPLQKYYPDASCSDYQSLDSKTWEKISGITDDGLALSGGNSEKVGDTSTYSYYFNHPSKDFYDKHDQYASFNDAVYEMSAFNSFLYEVNFTRHMYNSTDTKQIAPWICSHNYSRDKISRWGSSAYYTEQLYHLGLFDPEPFLLYNTEAEMGGAEGKVQTSETVNAIMKALTDVAGYADREPIQMPQYWNAEFAVSGMYAGGRNIWRITPNTDEISLSAFKKSDKDPTFSVKGQTITFPGGKILKEATIPNVGSCGYWVETAKNVTPVMTADADRYAKYPSYLESFNYANGALTPDKMKESYAWEYNLSSGSSATVTNNALSLTGTALFRNVEIPAKITAGDSYAEEQTWEMTFTLPSGLSSDAEICLLQYGHAGSSGKDSGIKIKGGKVYYGEDIAGTTTTQELTSINPGTYTVKRVMNFGNAKNFTYSLYLLDSKGKELASAKNISTPFFSAIESISFSTKNANKAVVVDDYKLYPSGVAADFELYDASSGKNLLGSDAENARNKSTAFRLSWLNGTSSARTMTVVAAIYENGSLKAEKAVKSVIMKPGHDGVITGVVDVKAGQSVHVYLKNGGHTDVEYDKPGATESGSIPEKTEATKATSTTASATSATKATNASKVTKATKTPTRSTRPTMATKPGETLAPDATDATEVTDVTTLTEATEATYAADATDATDATTATTATTPEEPKDNNRSSTIIIIVACAVGVLAAAGGASVIMKKKSMKTPKDITEIPEETDGDLSD